MHKTRSKMFTEKMKEVFKPRSRCPDSRNTSFRLSGKRLNRESKLESTIDKEVLRQESFSVSQQSGKASKGSFSFYPFGKWESPPKFDSRLQMSSPDSLKDAPDSTTRVWTDRSSVIAPRGDEPLGLSPGGVFDDLPSYTRVARSKKNNNHESCRFCDSETHYQPVDSPTLYNERLSQRSRRFQHQWRHGNRDSCTQCHVCLKHNCTCDTNSAPNANITNNNIWTSSRAYHKNKPLENYRGNLNIANGAKDQKIFPSVLQHAFGQEKINRNDLIILSLGIHHYIKEVFNAMDYCNNGYVLREDLNILFQISGKSQPPPRETPENSSSPNDSRSGCNKEGSCADNSCNDHLHFGKFSEIICNAYSNSKDTNNNNSSSSSSCLENRKNTQLVNAIVTIKRRNESLNTISKQLEDLESSYVELNTRPKGSLGNSTTWKNNEDSKDYTSYTTLSNPTYLENLKLQKIILLQQQELQCLREVIEDLRVSLQCSDAENLSLRVRQVKSKERRLSEEESNRGSSNDSEKDSVDRLILNFPSTDHLDKDSFNESLGSSDQARKPVPRQGDRISSSPSKLTLNRLPEEPRDATGFFYRGAEEDLINLEIKSAQKQLSESRLELESARVDLETSVLDIQTKQVEIQRLNKSLIDMKANFDKSLKENSNLKEKIVIMKREEETKLADIEVMANRFKILNSQMLKQREESKTLGDVVRELKSKRISDIRQLNITRNLIAKGLTEVKTNEESLMKKTLLLMNNRQDQSTHPPNRQQKEKDEILNNHSINNNITGDKDKFRTLKDKNDNYPIDNLVTYTNSIDNVVNHRDGEGIKQNNTCSARMYNRYCISQCSDVDTPPQSYVEASR